VTIDSFEIDHNCADVNIPYTPFQQLLSIMPLKSIGLLPPGYGGIARSEELRAFFPQDFDIDLNGRALPWEAACLIPFVDEKLFIENESKMIHAGPQFSEEDKKHCVIIQIWGPLVDILVSIAPDVYGPYVTTNKQGQQVLIVDCLNAVYGIMVAALLYYKVCQESCQERI
jgi:hypothetical protein